MIQEQLTFETRIAAYERIRPYLSKTRLNILEFLRLNPDSSANDYAQSVGKPVHKVSGRFSDLKNNKGTFGNPLPLIRETGKKLNADGLPVATYRIVYA